MITVVGRPGPSCTLHEHCELRLAFDPRTDYNAARQDVINR
jgi:hypothetical protein